MNMDKLDALAKSVRDMLRDLPYIKRIEVEGESNADGVSTEVTVHNNDGTVLRIVRSGEAPF